MAKPCEHLQDLAAADFPPPRTPGACEECLKEEFPRGVGGQAQQGTDFFKAPFVR
jgi:hypothetical protein